MDTQPRPAVPGQGAGEGVRETLKLAGKGENRILQNPRSEFQRCHVTHLLDVSCSSYRRALRLLRSPADAETLAAWATPLALLRLGADPRAIRKPLELGA